MPSARTATSWNRRIWETYLEPRYRDRALRIVKDDDGLDVPRSTASPRPVARGMPSTLAAMGRGNLGAMARDPEITYDNHAPPKRDGRQGPLELLDAEHIDAAVLYTTTGLLWEAELTDVELSQAYCQAEAVDLRVAWTERAGWSRPPTCRSGIRRPQPGAGAGRGRRCPQDFVAPFTRRAAPLGHRPRPGVRRGPGTSTCRWPSIHLRAPVDQGHPHGWLGENVRRLRLSASVQASDGGTPTTSTRRCSTTGCSTGFPG